LLIFAEDFGALEALEGPPKLEKRARKSISKIDPEGRGQGKRLGVIGP